MSNNQRDHAASAPEPLPHADPSQQPGLEVVDSPQYAIKSGIDPYAAATNGQQPGLEAAYPPQPDHYNNNGYNNTAYGDGGYNKYAQTSPPIEQGQKQERRICGLKRWVFFAILAVIIIAAVGGGVGGALGSKKSSNSNSNDPSPNDPTPTGDAPTSQSTPTAVAAVGLSISSDLTVIYQYATTSDRFKTTDFYIAAGVGGDWKEPLKITGLNPAPQANSSFSVIQIPNNSTIYIYYMAENGTMFDASGTVGSGEFKMGRLAPDTNYGVLVSEGSGFQATPWMVGTIYGLRLYYIDRVSQNVRELAYNEGGKWVITGQSFAKGSKTSKLALAWLPASNFTFKDDQVLHLFWQNERANLLHLPSYNGAWDEASHLESLGTIPDGTYITGSIMDDNAKKVLRVLWLNSDGELTSLRGNGGSIKTIDNLEAKGTFGSPVIVSKQEGNSVPKANGGGKPLSAITHFPSIRLYYQTEQNPNVLTEIGFDGDKWFTAGTTNQY